MDLQRIDCADSAPREERVQQRAQVQIRLSELFLQMFANLANCETCSEQMNSSRADRGRTKVSSALRDSEEEASILFAYPQWLQLKDAAFRYIEGDLCLSHEAMPEAEQALMKQITS